MALVNLAADAHARRVTLNLAARSVNVDPTIRPIVSRLAASGWDFDALPKADLEMLYASLDESTTETILREWNVNTKTIRDWGYPFDDAGNLFGWCVPADKREVDCELCGHKHNRWEFLAENSHNGATMWMGSTCVEKYRFTVDGASTAEAALTRLKGALKIVATRQTRQEWNAAHPDADAVIRELADAQNEAGRYLSYKTARAHGVFKRTWDSRCRKFVSAVKAIRKYFDANGYLTPSKTAKAWALSGRRGS